MSIRDTAIAMLDSLLAFGRVTASKQATNTKQVLVSLRGNSDGTRHEERPYQALWGHAAILFRPPADTEVIFARTGDEMVPIASRETRWAIDVEEGEVVVRNLSGDTPARVRLLANGEILIEAGKVGHVDAGDAMAVATKALALAEKCDSNFSAVRTAFNLHKHSETGATTNVPDSLIGALQSVASARVFTKD